MLAGRRNVEVTLPPEPVPMLVADAAAADPDLFERLRRWRAEVARRDGVPAYVIFHDRTLTALAARRPVTLADLETVPGVGPAKLARYGPDLLQVLG